jgi:hypothetical protein
MESSSTGVASIRLLVVEFRKWKEPTTMAAKSYIHIQPQFKYHFCMSNKCLHHIKGFKNGSNINANMLWALLAL